MIKKLLILLISFLLIPTLVFGGATFSRIKTWITGDTLTASDINAEFNNILNNFDPDGMDDTSANTSGMQATSDPYSGDAISLSTDLTGEIKRLRYVVNQILGSTYWYIYPDYTEKTTTSTLVLSESVVTASATSTFTLTLPTAVGNKNKVYTIKKIDSSTNSVIIDGNSSETIDGSTTYTLQDRYDFIQIVSDDSNWHIIGKNPPSTIPLGGLASARGLVASSTTDEQIDIDITEMVLHSVDTTTATTTKRLVDVDLTLDNIVSGINGIDTGSVASSTWYFLWIANGTSGSGGLLSTASTTANLTLPSGYDTYAGLIGAIKTDGSSDFVNMHQRGNRARSAGGSFAITTTAATEKDISEAVPTTARLAYFVSKQSTGAGRLYIHPTDFTVATGNAWYERFADTGSSTGQGEVPIETAQKIWVARDSNDFTLYMQGWQY